MINDELLLILLVRKGLLCGTFASMLLFAFPFGMIDGMECGGNIHVQLS